MNIRPRDRVAIIAIACVALIGAYYLLALKPERQTASRLSASILTQRQKLAEAEQSYTAGRTAAASLRSTSAQWAALQLAVPEQANIPALLRTLDRTANSVGVQMQAITLSGSSAASTSAPATGSSASSATEVPVQLTFKGDYLDMNRLVKRLNSFVTVSGNRVHATGPLLSISNVSLTGPPSLTVQMTASIYQLNTGATTGGQP